MTLFTRLKSSYIRRACLATVGVTFCKIMPGEAAISVFAKPHCKCLVEEGNEGKREKKMGTIITGQYRLCEVYGPLRSF